MRTKIVIFAIVPLVLMSIVGCSLFRKTTPQPGTVNLALTKEPQANKYVKLDYGIKVNVHDKRALTDILKKHDGYNIEKPVVRVQPAVESFVYESMKRYMRTMGFVLNADVETDYMMDVHIGEFHVSYLSGTGWQGTVCLNIEIHDHNRTLVYPNTVIIGRANSGGSGNDYVMASNVINKAYVNALNDIDWDRIAYFLKRSSSPALEGNKKVGGEGNTALENQVINWSIYSSPKGCDVYWRVISSTDDVKNTNRNYLGTTPYESTETFDIKGLTYNNSGNVQIEVSCEKDGFLMQKKKFNLRQVIDQKEISTKFNLVSE